MTKKSAWDDENKNESDSHLGKERKTLTPDTSKLLVRKINDDTEYLHAELGITDENGKRLARIVRKLVNKDLSIGEVLVELSKECNHVNELVLMAFSLGRNTGEPRGDNRKPNIQAINLGGADAPPGFDDFIKGILGDIIKRKRDRDNDGDDS